jgi:hypothetical protein
MTGGSNVCEHYRSNIAQAANIEANSGEGRFSASERSPNDARDGDYCTNVKLMIILAVDGN